MRDTTEGAKTDMCDVLLWALYMDVPVLADQLQQTDTRYRAENLPGAMGGRD